MKIDEFEEDENEKEDRKMREAEAKAWDAWKEQQDYDKNMDRLWTDEMRVERRLKNVKDPKKRERILRGQDRWKQVRSDMEQRKQKGKHANVLDRLVDEFKVLLSGDKEQKGRRKKLKEEKQRKEKEAKQKVKELQDEEKHTVDT